MVSCLARPSATWVSPTLSVLLYGCVGLCAMFTVINLRTVDLPQAGVILGFFFLRVRYARGTGLHARLPLAGGSRVP